MEGPSAELGELREQSRQNAASPLRSRTSTGLDPTCAGTTDRLPRRPSNQIAAMLQIPFHEVDLLLQARPIVLDRI
ncbi:MAG TPA: hypothetical protein VKB88_22015 [Bryobacteraceae bacterium]|nr:hypothetical protein [Bryobacteraceae bacterium]